MNNKLICTILISIVAINFNCYTQGGSVMSEIQSTIGTIQTSHAPVWYKKFFTNESEHKTPILCLHGGPGFSHHCMLDLEALAADHPVILYDQSGCGNSKTTTDDAFDNWSFDHYLTELEEFIDALGYEKVILLGYSWGGTLALKYASLHQDKLEALVLASPLISTKQWVADCKTLAASIAPEFLELIEKHEAAGTTTDQQYQEATTIFYNNFLCRMQPWPKNVLDACSVMNPIVYHTMWGPSEFTAIGNLQDVDLTHELSNIFVPTLITCGRYDMATPERMQEYAHLLPNGKVAMLEHSAHMNIPEEPEVYVRILREFLA